MTNSYLQYCPVSSLWDLILEGEVEGQMVKQTTCSFCHIHFGPLKIHTIENVNPITKTQLIIRDKSNRYSISQYEDKETLIGDWTRAVSDSKVSRKSTMYNSNEKELYLLFMSAVKHIENKHMPVIFESYMLYKDYDGMYKSPDLESYTTFNVEKTEGKYIYKPFKDDTSLFNFKRTEILRLTEFKKLEGLIREFSRSPEELSIYKTLICWTITGMMKKQLIDIGFGLYPAVVLIGEKKSGKSTAMKTFCDIGIKDYCKTGTSIRETTIKNLFNTTFPVMFDEISNINIEVLDLFKSGLTSGYVYNEKGKNTGAGGESFIHRKLNPYIFSANTLTIPDEALMRRLIVIDYPKQEMKKTETSIIELQGMLQSFYKIMFIDMIPKWLNANSLKTMREKIMKGVVDERLIYLKFGEEILNQYNFLSDVELYHNEVTIETGGKNIVQEKDLIFTDIKRLIQTAEYYEKKDDIVYTPKMVLRDNISCPECFDKFGSSGIYILYAKKKKDKILISNEILPKLDVKIRNKYKSITQLSKILEKEMSSPRVHTGVGSTSKYGIVYCYDDLFDESRDDHVKIEDEGDEDE